MDTSVFEQVASSLTVKSICSPLGPDVPGWLDVGQLEEQLDPGSDLNLDPWQNPSRVIDSEGNVVGMLSFDDYVGSDSDEDVEDVMERPEPYRFLSSATSILDAIELFGTKRNGYFYVLDINEIVGTLSYGDLSKPLGRLAVFAFALEIENLALRLCQFKPIRERCWLSIPENRKRKSIDLFKDKYKREPGPGFLPTFGLIECTNLIDKATMIWKQKLIAPATRADVLGFFKSLNRIRNRCAHAGGDEDLLPREALSEFISSAKRMRRSLHEAMQTHGIGLRKEPVEL
jgi:CBS domain